MINDEHDQHDDEHTDDDVMHDMHTNTMHHAWCQRMPQGNTHAQTHKRIKMHKNKRNVTKTRKKFKGTNPTMAFKKTMGTKQDERKGGPNTVRDPLNMGPTSQNKTETKQNETHTTQFM